MPPHLARPPRVRRIALELPAEAIPLAQDLIRRLYFGDLLMLQWLVQGHCQNGVT